MEVNPTIMLDELAALVHHRLETEERALKNTKNVFETDKIFDSVRILGWIKYLIIEKNGRIVQRLSMKSWDLGNKQLAGL
jgi:hypothetical protein